MNYLRTLFGKANPRKHPNVRRAYSEVLVALCVVVTVGVLGHFISPYRAPSSTLFYDSSGQTQTTYHRATIDAVEAGDDDQQRVSATILDGPESDSTTTIVVSQFTQLSPGDTIVLSQNQSTGTFMFADYHRLPLMMTLLAVFIAIVLLVGRGRGATSIAGLIVSVGIIGFGIVPFILGGYDALWVCIIGAFLIAIPSILIAHGFRRRTYISLACILFILLLVAIAAELVVHALQLSGLHDETAGMLAIGSENTINLSGLLVGGIIIASLGVLDDIVTAQVAVVEELLGANEKLSLRDIYMKAWSVGTEHIAALVNTLALVYAGAALPLILIISSGASNLFVFFNSEYMITEIVRTLITSTALVLAVPISTLVASAWLHRRVAKAAQTTH